MTDLCPSCLTELPANYPYDHVRIDQVLTGRYRRLFDVMGPGERREVVLTGLSRRLSLTAIAERIGSFYSHLQKLLPDEHPLSVASQSARLERQVRELYAEDLPDAVIGLRIGKQPGEVSKLRNRLRLPAKFGPGGRRLVTS